MLDLHLVTKRQRKFFFRRKRKIITVSCRTGVISRAGAEYFSLVKIMVANFDFKGRAELGRERKLH